MFLLSPVLLGCSMGIPALFVDLRSSAVLLIWGVLHVANLDSIMQTFLENNSIGEAFFIGVLWAFMVAISLIVGYVFVGIVLLIEKMLKQRGMFKTEEES